jgi:hypothetical protein
VIYLSQKIKMRVVMEMAMEMMMMKMTFQRSEGHAERKSHRICGMNIKTPTATICSEC